MIWNKKAAFAAGSACTMVASLENMSRHRRVPVSSLGCVSSTGDTGAGKTACRSSFSHWQQGVSTLTLPWMRTPP